MRTPSEFALITSTLVVLYMAGLTVIAVFVEPGVPEKLELYAGFLSIGAGAISAALWIRSALPAAAKHTNIMGAVSTAAAVMYSAVGTFGDADLANQGFVFWCQVGAIVAASGLLICIFIASVRITWFSPVTPPVKRPPVRSQTNGQAKRKRRRR